MNRGSRGAFRLAHAAWLFGIFAFFVPPATWNPVSRFDLTRAVVEECSLSIDRDVTNTGDRAFVAGHWFTDKPPVVSVAAVPVYAIVRVLQRIKGAEPSIEVFGTEQHPAVRLKPNAAFQQALYACSLATAGASGVAVGLLLFEFLRRRTLSKVAFGASSLVVLGTSILPYATSFYSHVPAAALLLGAVVLLDRRGMRPADALPSPSRQLWAGACLALAPGCEYLTAAPAALIGLAFVLHAPQGARVRLAKNLALGGLLPAAALATYHQAVFGAPWRTGYSFMTKPEFAAGHASGLMGIHLPTLAGSYGLVLGVRRGLFYVSPLAAFGVMFGIRQARRRKDFAVGVGLGVLALLFWLNAGYYMWWGGAAAGPRHLVPGLAFLAPGVVLGLRARWRWVRRLTVALGVLSIVNMVAITAAGIEAPERADVLRSYAWPRVVEGRLAAYAGGSNLGHRLGLPGAVSLLPLLLWGVGGFFYLRRRVRVTAEVSSRS